ncbi:MAG: VanW family protein [Clostridia bacterium]|nr:VanW family protein [Clostridia bacterium]
MADDSTTRIDTPEDAAVSSDAASAAAPKRTVLTVLIILGCIVLAAILALGIYGLVGIINEKAEVAAEFQARYEAALERESLISDPHFRAGVTVYDVDLSGMTLEEGRAAVRQKIDEKLNSFEFDLTKNGETLLTLNSVNLGITTDFDRVIVDAYSLARRGTLEEVKAELADIEQNGRAFDIEFTIDSSLVEAIADELRGDIDVAPSNASFVIDPENTEQFFLFTPEVYGSAVDAGILERLTKYKFNNDNTESLAVPMSSIVPSVTVASLSKLLQPRAVFSTSYAMSSGANRVHNIKKAAGLVNGTVLQPGEVFSINDCLGYRTIESGWLPAPAIIMGGASTEDQPGGGVCQVSTTMYNAVVMADLEVVYRRGHSRVSDYAAGGLDATIDSGRIDFQFKNSTEHPLYVFCWVETGAKRVWCAVYGEAFPATFDRIEFVSQHIETIQPSATEYITDPTLEEGYWMLRNNARTGYIYDTYKVYYLNDVVVQRVFVDRTEYKMHPLRYYVWQGYIPGTPLDPEFEIIPDEGGD